MTDGFASVEERAENVKAQLERVMQKMQTYRNKGFTKLPISVLDDVEFLLFVITIQADANNTLREQLTLALGPQDGQLVGLAGEILETSDFAPGTIFEP